MKKIYEELNNWGCDVKGALERVSDDEELYEKCLNLFLEDEGFSNIKKALDKKDIGELFDIVHTLKGVAANLGLDPLFEALSIFTEDLRIKNISNAQVEYDDVMKQYKIFSDILKK